MHITVVDSRNLTILQEALFEFDGYVQAVVP
jgi:hypothetical protein